jgi:site-specific DNA-methyltransferase (adenine-specific)
MGKKWDYDVPSVELWREVLRVLKPGGTLLCFGGPKTSHRTAVNIEDAGFKLCDTLMWLHGQGMSHSLNLSKKMIEKHETNAAKKWEGWHSHHLGPGYEPIVMAIKDNEGTYIENAIKWGIGGLNAKACRIPGGEVTINTFDNGAKPFGDAVGEPYTSRKSSGRYPKNLLHDGSDEVLAGFPNVKAGKAIRHRSGGKNCHSDTQKPPMPDLGYDDSGSAARFFNRLGWAEDELRFRYCAKANKKERGEGNNHPTVKPLALMRWLVRLVCPPGGIVLDPFMGSGTTGVACREEGFNFIGIERESESYETAVKRC